MLRNQEDPLKRETYKQTDYRERNHCLILFEILDLIVYNVYFVFLLFKNPSSLLTSRALLVFS